MSNMDTKENIVLSIKEIIIIGKGLYTIKDDEITNHDNRVKVKLELPHTLLVYNGVNTSICIKEYNINLETITLRWTASVLISENLLSSNNISIILNESTKFAVYQKKWHNVRELKVNVTGDSSFEGTFYAEKTYLKSYLQSRITGIRAKKHVEMYAKCNSSIVVLGSKETTIKKQCALYASAQFIIF